MSYSREELDWIEAEWAFHLHGRSAFLSQEDFRQVMAWDSEGVGAESLVAAMDTYFSRRAKRARPRAFVTMAHLARDVAKAVKLREALVRAGADGPRGPLPGAVDERLQKDPRTMALLETWGRWRVAAPPPDSPGFLDHFDAERAARKDFLDCAEKLLGGAAATGRAELAARLHEAGVTEASPVWRRAFDHHWGKLVLEAFGIPDV